MSYLRELVYLREPILSRFSFTNVIDVVFKEIIKDLFYEVSYADDLVLVNDSIKEQFLEKVGSC